MESLILQFEKLFAADDLAGAKALAASFEGQDPARYEAAQAALSVHAKHAPEAEEHARRAEAHAPGDPVPPYYLAVAAILREDKALAVGHAEQAVARGGGLRALGLLGNLYLETGRVMEAEATYRRMLDLDPQNVQALNGVGAARYKQQDMEGAIGFFARAYEQAPIDTQPLRSILNMLFESGRVLGALAMGQMCRERYAEEGSKVALDLALIHLTKMLLSSFPPRTFSDDIDEIVTRAVRGAQARSAAVSIGVARSLIDYERLEDAERAVSNLDAADESLSPQDRGSLLFVLGLIAARRGDEAQALLSYKKAVEANPEQWDACCNAISILLERGERGDAGALTEIGDLLARVPAYVRGSAPQLAFNEAVYLRQMGRIEEAKRRLSRVLLITQGQGDLGQLARDTLSELPGAKA